MDNPLDPPPRYSKRDPLPPRATPDERTPLCPTPTIRNQRTSLYSADAISNQQTRFYLNPNIRGSANEDDYPARYRRRRVKPGTIIAISLATIALLLLAWLVFVFVFAHQEGNDDGGEQKHPVTYSVAVIGAGPAGITAAGELRRLAAQTNGMENVDVTVFERGKEVGGRLTGHSDVHPFDDTRVAPLSAKEIFGARLLSFLARNGERRSGKVGFYNGNSLYCITRPSSAASQDSWLDHIFHYGHSPDRAGDLSALGGKGLEDLFKYTSDPFTLEAAAKSLGISKDLAKEGRQRLRDAKISELYERDLLEPAVRRRFGRTIDGLNSYALTVAMYDGDDGMGAETSLEVEPYFRNLVFTSGAKLELETHVTGISKNSSTSYILETRKDGSAQSRYMLFNAVVLAMPFDSSDLKIKESSFRRAPEMLEYNACHVTLFTSKNKIRSDAFHATEDLPGVIFGGQQPGLRTEPFDFFEMGMIRTVSRHGTGEEEYLYRISSPESIPLSDIIGLVGDTVTWSYDFEISRAYPSLPPRDIFPPVQLDDAVFHTSASESLVSSVEMAFYTGKGVARRVFRALETS